MNAKQAEKLTLEVKSLCLKNLTYEPALSCNISSLTDQILKLGKSTL
jgi:hypothetical protein